MKKALPILVLLTLAAVALPAAALDRDQAVTVVKDTQLGGSLADVRLWVAPTPLRAGEAVGTWRRDVFRADADGWFVFVDLHPGANWEHPCAYHFVDSVTGQVTSFDAMTPPSDLADLVEITSGRDNPEPGVSEAMLDRFSERLRSLPKPPPVRQGAWAYIISGGANQSNNHIRYWNDCAFIYRTLVEYYGYADDHIRVAISDGTSPAVDRSDGTNSPADLDGDGDADIEVAATLAGVDQIFDELAATLTPSDQLFIFTTDHGGQQSGHDCYLNLWNLQELHDDQMAVYVAALPCQSIICTFEQCFSGGMVDDLQGDGRVIATGANWDEYSWAMGPDYIYDTFVYHWTSAVAWETPYGVPVDADTNNDGIVSMHEAFLYAQANDHDDETPQYSSTPANLGDALNLIGNLEGVYVLVESFAIDDVAGGDGDGVIEFGETIELTVTLHNLGQQAAVGLLGQLTTTSPYVQVIAGGGDWGDIPADGSAANAIPLVIAIDPNVPDGAALGLGLSVNEPPNALAIETTAAAPAWTVSVARVEDLSGDHDGIADPGETARLTLRFENVGGCDGPALDAWLGSAGYISSDGAEASVAPIAAGGWADVEGFRVEIADACPEIHSALLPLHLTGTGGYAADCEVVVWVGPWFDDAELDLGWTIGLATDTATSGFWVRANPVGTTYSSQPVQPEDDHSPAPGTFCFVTGNGAAGGAAGENDVDGGTTTLLSPVFDVAGATSATLSYWRWYTNNLGNNPDQDYWRVDVTADGTTWVSLENTLASANAWNQYTFDLASYVPLTGTLQMRFVADDQSPGSLVEAALDDITVSILRSDLTAAPEPERTTVVSGLSFCRPNPVSSSSQISYRLAAAGPVRIDLYDVAGRRVRTLVQADQSAGEHTVTFTPADAAGRPIAAGVYFVRMQTPDLTQVRQVTVVR